MYQFTLISYSVGVRCEVDIFKLTAPAQSGSREVYSSVNIKLESNLNNVLTNLYNSGIHRTHLRRRYFFRLIIYSVPNVKIFFQTPYNNK